MNQVQQTIRLQDFIQDSFSGGINTAVPSEHLADNEAQDIVNLEFTDDDHLQTRSGVRLWQGSSDPLYNEQFPARITSVHYYENDDGDIAILVTSGNKLFASPNSNPNFIEVSASPISALNLPEDNFWMWRNWQGLAIGVNRGGTGYTNPVKYDGEFAAQLGGNPPKLKYIEIWNERLWGVSVDDPNVVYCSKLGDPENWTLTTLANSAGIFDVGKNDGDRITGIYTFRGQLFVFKRTKIYIISTLQGTIPTDIGNLQVTLYANNIGCVSPYSIQEVLDDVLFLSDSGIASLVSAPLGELKTAIVSRNVKEIRSIRKQSQEISSLVIEHANQYWLIVPAKLSPRNIDEVYVFDVKRIQEGFVRWIRFEGKVAGTVAGNMYVNGERLVLIGGVDKKMYSYFPGLITARGVYGEAIYGISSYNDSSNFKIFQDEEEAFRKRILTKAFDFKKQFTRKKYHRFGIDITLLSEIVDLNVCYYFDKNLSSEICFDLSFNIYNENVYGAAIYGESLYGQYQEYSLYGQAIYGTNLYYGIPFTNNNGDLIALRQFNRERQRKAMNVTFDISNFESEGFTFKNLYMEYEILNIKRVNKISVVN